MSTPPNEGLRPGPGPGVQVHSTSGRVAHGRSTGWKTVTSLDHGRGLPLTTKDENGRTALRSYDSLGRVVSIWQPGQDRANDPPVRKFSYAMNGVNAPTTVLSQTLMNNNAYSSYTIYDGLGRVRQTQAPTPSGVHGRMITDALFDSHGRQVKTSAPYFNDEKVPGGALFLPDGGVNPDSKIPAQTVNVFDGLGRTTASVFQSFGVEQWRSRTEYPGADEVRTIPSAGGYATATVTNGTTSLLRQYKANTPTGAYDETTYETNAAGLPLRGGHRVAPSRCSWMYSVNAWTGMRRARPMVSEARPRFRIRSCRAEQPTSSEPWLPGR